MMKKKAEEIEEAQRIHLTAAYCEDDNTMIPFDPTVQSTQSISSEKLIPVEGTQRTPTELLQRQPIMAPKNVGTADSKEKFDVPPNVMLFVRRIIALLVDQVVCLCLGLMLVVPPSLILAYLIFEAPFKISTELETVAIVGTILCAIMGALLSTFFYCAKFESSRWQATPGKLLMGLRVVDEGGNRIKYGGVIWRLVIQGFVMWFLGPCLAVLTVASLFVLHLGSKSFLELAIPMISIGACYLVALFTPRRQTLFDIATRRIVESSQWSISKQLTWRRLFEGIDIMSKGRRERRDWLLILCAGWAITMLVLSFGLLPLFSCTLIETDHSLQISSKRLEMSPRYLNASRWFKSVDLLYYLASRCHSLIGDSAASMDDLKKMMLIAPNNWVAHCAYGLRLEANGDFASAKSEFWKAACLKDATEDDDNPWSKKIGLTSFSFHTDDTLSSTDLYLKLGKLSHQLGQHKQAIGFLDKAIEMDQQDPQKYLIRSDAYRALGNIRQAELDKDKANKILRLDMGGWRMQLYRGRKSGSVEWSGQ